MPEWKFSFILENATEEQANRIADAFIDAVEKEGLRCNGGYKTCQEEASHSR